jgi:hypothetical protein
LIVSSFLTKPLTIVFCIILIINPIPFAGKFKKPLNYGLFYQNSNSNPSKIMKRGCLKRTFMMQKSQIGTKNILAQIAK